MKQDIFYASKGQGQIRACHWTPEDQPKAVVQIVHGIAEHVDRYDHFAAFLNSKGIAVVAEDHMGHGKSIGKGSVQGYFHGGWFTAVEDTCQLMNDTMEKYPNVPYILFGHSMGSFMARTILAKYPDCGITGCIISGTGWQPAGLMKAGIPLCKLICKMVDEKKPNDRLNAMIFGGYNKKVEHPRTFSDWLTRDDSVVDAYAADPLSGFVPAAGLLRDMMIGIEFIQRPESLAAMNKQLPVLFIAGGDDPVGNYGEGVRETVRQFEAAGMMDVKTRIYPLGRHEMLNEINKEEVYDDVLNWINGLLP